MAFSTLFQKFCLILVIHLTTQTEHGIIRTTYGKHYLEFIYTSESASIEETRKKSQTQNRLVDTNITKDVTQNDILNYVPTQYPLLWNVNKQLKRSKRQIRQNVIFLAPSANKTLVGSDTLINNIFTTLNKTLTSGLENQRHKQVNNITPKANTMTRDKIVNVVSSDSRNSFQREDSNIVNGNPTLTRQINSQNNWHRTIQNLPTRASQTNTFGSVNPDGFNNQVRQSGAGNFDRIAQRSSNQRPFSSNVNTMNRPGTSSQQAPRQGQIAINGRFANFDPTTAQRNHVAHRILPSNQPTPLSRGAQTEHSLHTFHGRFLRGFEFGTPLLTPQLEQSSTSFDNAPTGRNNWGAINGMANTMNSFPALNSGMGLPFQHLSIPGFF